ncbi:DUF1850 domain-containing protein [Guptibacillus hwajinpoensis]|uniref:DUF1850 domain-containing protein n=1 Tax=Guptibacillus hwajinpoensis TaxID=208199 RepID=UPI001A7EBE74|nr:DUF1850 domain-containing protein [Pseudalkalibacillus hwajinpoensis]WLR57853.1 DUF1850 domain-containing protein [Pseudalkalibacillus hwajinpoensis]
MKSLRLLTMKPSDSTKQFMYQTTIAVALILVVFLYPFFPVMALEKGESGKVLAYVPFEDDPANFDIRYTHSVHKTPVQESYYVSESGEIVQYELSYENFAIGMPSNADAGERFVQDKDGYKIKDMNRKFPFIDMRTGQVVANHVLLVQDKEIELSRIIEPGSWLHLESETISLWQWMKGVNVLE